MKPSRIAACLIITLFALWSVPASGQQDPVAAIKDGNVAQKLQAVRAIQNLPAEAKKNAVPQLIQLLKEPDENVRVAAASALQRLGGLALPVLVDLLKEPKEDKNVKIYAASIIGDIGPSAKGSIPDLVDALKDPDVILRVNLIHALGGMAPEAKDALAPLQEALKDGSAAVRSSAAFALGRFGANAAAAAGTLNELKEKDPSPVVRDLAAKALAKIQPM